MPAYTPVTCCCRIWQQSGAHPETHCTRRESFRVVFRCCIPDRIFRLPGGTRLTVVWFASKPPKTTNFEKRPGNRGRDKNTRQKRLVRRQWHNSMSLCNALLRERITEIKNFPSGPDSIFWKFARHCGENSTSSRVFPRNCGMSGNRTRRGIQEHTHSTGSFPKDVTGWAKRCSHGRSGAFFAWWQPGVCQNSERCGVSQRAEQLQSELQQTQTSPRADPLLSPVWWSMPDARFGGAKRDNLLVPLRFTVYGRSTFDCPLARFRGRLPPNLFTCPRSFPVRVSLAPAVSCRTASGGAIRLIKSRWAVALCGSFRDHVRPFSC